MPYPAPATWLRTTIAVTNVITDYTIIAAPGLGLALRVIYFKLGILRGAAVQTADGTFRDGPGGTVRWSWSLSSPEHLESIWDLPYPGYLMPANTAIVTTATSTVAGPTNYHVSVGYFTDQLN
jgi:hypothetical protein